MLDQVRFLVWYFNILYLHIPYYSIIYWVRSLKRWRSFSTFLEYISLVIWLRGCFILRQFLCESKLTGRPWSTYLIYFFAFLPTPLANSIRIYSQLFLAKELVRWCCIQPLLKASLSICHGTSQARARSKFHCRLSTEQDCILIELPSDTQRYVLRSLHAEHNYVEANRVSWPEACHLKRILEDIVRLDTLRIPQT